MGNLKIEGLSHLVVEVSDLNRGEEFYRAVLGFEPAGHDLWPDCGLSLLMQTAGKQYLILSESPEPRSLPETGVHQAYSIALAEHPVISKKLAARGIDVHTYKEDRPSEAEDNFYFYDPDGNRVQLVTSKANSKAASRVQGIDHAAVESCDLEWAEDFYVKALHLPVDHRVGWNTADYKRAKLWGEGKEEMAPGTRRWDQRYTTMEQKRRLPRPNTHFFVRFGDAVLGIFLALEHRQEPPEELRVGTPRIAFRASRQVLDEAAKALREHGFSFDGPIDHASPCPISASLYFKDPGGNFLELATPRQAA